MPLSIFKSHAVPAPRAAAPVVEQVTAITRRLVNGSARDFFPSSNPQTANPPWPILLYDQVTVQSGAEQDFRGEAFTNNFGRPIELRALRVFISPQISNTQQALIRGGGVIALAIEIDGVMVTQGAVPVWHLARSDNRRNDSAAVYANPVTTFAWFFSHPVPLLPGRGMKIQARHLGVTTQDAVVSVAFAGAVCGGAVPPRRIPFAASWTSEAFAYDEAGVDSAPPSALVNGTKRDLVVDRIIGRAVAYDDASLGAGWVEMMDQDDVSAQGATSFLVRLGLSQSRPILKTFTPWRAVFGQNAALETDFVLRAGDYFTADVQHIAGPTLPTPFTFSQNRGSISIVGWREV